MQVINEHISQKDRISKLLMELNTKITESDRDDFFKKKNISKVTISNYMNGKGSNIDTAMEMLLFFRKKIEDREKLIGC